MEKPEKWETCLNVLRYGPTRILLISKFTGSHKRNGDLVLDKKKCEDCLQWKGWREKTDRDILKIKMTDCRYSSKGESQNN